MSQDYSDDAIGTQKLLTRDTGNSFNFFRVFFAALVILSHSFPLLYGMKSEDPLAHLLSTQISRSGEGSTNLGAVAVYSFFAISGFLVTMSWQRSQGVFDYLKKRILRIYPAYAVTAVVCIFAVGYLGASDKSAYYSQAWALKGLNARLVAELKGFITPPVFRHNPLPDMNGSLWTIPYEFRCYLFVMVLGVLAKQFSRIFAPALKRILPGILFLAVYAVYAAHCAGHLLGWLGVCETGDASNHLPVALERFGNLIEKLGDPLVWPRLLVYFLGGLCFYLYRNLIPYKRSLFFTATAGLLISAFPFHLIVFTLPIFGLYILMYAAFSPTPSLANFGRKRDLSYGIYLYGWPVQQMLILFFPGRFNPYSLFLSALILAAGLAALSWHFIEKPSLRLKASNLRLAYLWKKAISYA